jgi:hypothetical protein
MRTICQESSKGSRPLALVGIAALVVGYVPLTGLDHLHLHIDHGLHFIHDHLHIGQHKHDHVARWSGRPVDRRDHRDSDDDEITGSAVVSFSHSSQLRPPAIDVTGQLSPVATGGEHRFLVDDSSTPHPSWKSRAPPG